MKQRNLMVMELTTDQLRVKRATPTAPISLKVRSNVNRSASCVVAMVTSLHVRSNENSEE